MKGKSNIQIDNCKWQQPGFGPQHLNSRLATLFPVIILCLFRAYTKLLRVMVTANKDWTYDVENSHFYLIF
jgi:hypothetical protein